MGLNQKISLLFAGLLAAFTIGSYFGLSGTMTQAFDDLEDRAAHQDLARARNGVTAILRMLSNASIDWGQWDASYAYIQGRNPSFLADNLEADSLIALDVNLMGLYDTANELYWGMYVDIASGEELPINSAIIDKRSLAALQQHATATSHTAGLLMSRLGPMLVSSRPITHSDRSGPVAGTLIIGRLLTESRIAVLRKTSEVQIDLSPLSTPDKSLSKRLPRNLFGRIDQTVTSEDRITRQVMHDIHGDPSATISVMSPRGITGLGRKTTRSVLYLFVIFGSAVIFGLGVILRRLVIRPIGTLRSAMISIQSDGERSDRVDMHRSDEIGDLATNFDYMLDKLDELKRQHVDQSFKAGMAEVAAGVLHNVRNSMMPIVNNISMAQNSVLISGNDNILRAVDELSSGNLPEDRQGKLLQYLGMAHSRSNEERSEIAENLEHAVIQLNHVTEILKDQERFTHANPVIEKVNLGDAIIAAKGVIPMNPTFDVSVDVETSVSELNVRAHRVGLLQILGNVFVNAYDAMKRSGKSDGTISISAAKEVKKPDSEVHLTIRDTGVGIGADELEHVFDRGYTTKDDGGGLGLHWSANALAGMDGSISASSDGPQKGAEFCIILKAA